MKKSRNPNRKTFTTMGLLGILVLALVPVIFFVAVKMKVDDDFEDLAEILQQKNQGNTSKVPIDTFHYYTVYIDYKNYIWLEGKYDSTVTKSDLEESSIAKRNLGSIHNKSSLLIIKPESDGLYSALTLLLDSLQAYPELKFAIDKTSEAEEAMLRRFE